MRITNSMISRTMLSDLNSNMAKLADTQRQVTTGKRISKLSDDPIGAITSMQLKSKLNRISQYQDNVKSAKEYLTQVETSLTEMNSIVTKSYETAINLASDYNAEDRNSVAEMIGQFRDHILELGNGTYGESYMFGGYNSTGKPFTVDAGGNLLYNGLDVSDTTNPALISEEQDILEYQIGDGMNVEVGFNGIDFMGMGENNIYRVIDDLYKALKGNSTAEEISTCAGNLLKAQDRILSNIAEVGGRTNRLDLIEERYEQDTINFSEMRSVNDDVDTTEALINFNTAKTVYTYALQVGAKTMDTSLMDFLR